MKISRRSFLFSLSTFAAGATLLSPAKARAYYPRIPFTPARLPKLDKVKRLNSLCFGSCNRQDWAQDTWPHIVKQDPDLFMWLGDNVYNDTEDMHEMYQKYQHQLNNPNYRQLLERVPVIGTWDDHDYGANDAGSEYPMREESRLQFLHFINEPKNSARWHQPGVYTSYTIGDAGEGKGEGKVKIILLDLRYNKTPGRRGANSDLMGEEQWTWFENEVANSDADFHLIVSSISVLSTSRPYTEDWDKYSNSYDRLFRVLDRHNPQGVLFLAGDKHIGSYASRPAGPRGQRYYEMLSSGINRTVPKFYKPIARRVYGSHKTFTEINFGHIRFNWDQENPQMICDIRGRLGQLALRRIFEKDPQTGLLYEVQQKGLPSIIDEEFTPSTFQLS
jgi:alkaline phosphatase D